MTRTREKLLVAVLAGLIIAGAAMFAVQPSLGGKNSSGLRASGAVLTLKLTS